MFQAFVQESNTITSLNFLTSVFTPQDFDSEIVDQIVITVLPPSVVMSQYTTKESLDVLGAIQYSPSVSNSPRLSAMSLQDSPGLLLWLPKASTSSPEKKSWLLISDT